MPASESPLIAEYAPVRLVDALVASDADVQDASERNLVARELGPHEPVGAGKLDSGRDRDSQGHPGSDAEPIALSESHVLLGATDPDLAVLLGALSPSARARALRAQTASGRLLIELRDSADPLTEACRRARVSAGWRRALAFGAILLSGTLFATAFLLVPAGAKLTRTEAAVMRARQARDAARTRRDRLAAEVEAAGDEYYAARRLAGVYGWRRVSPARAARYWDTLAAAASTEPRQSRRP